MTAYIGLPVLINDVSLIDAHAGGNCRNSANRFTSPSINNLGELNLR